MSYFLHAYAIGAALGVAWGLISGAYRIGFARGRLHGLREARAIYAEVFIPESLRTAVPVVGP